MKRAPFLGAAAALLAGCGGHQVMRALPGVASSPQNQKPGASFRLVPATADSIPENVLASPIIGEARRFDGATPPNGWMFAKGQTFSTAQYPQLSSILQHVRTSSGTFALPNYPFGVVIAVAGTFPSSPEVLARGARRTTLSASLGQGAQPVMGPTLSRRARVAQEQRDATLRETQQRLAAMPRPPRGGPSVPIAPELSSRIEQSRAETRLTALARLSAANRSRVETLVDAVVSGRVSTHDAQLQTATVLSADEVNALLELHDAHVRAFRSGWAGMQHLDPRLEAANFAVEITITPEQERAFAQLPQNR